MRPDPRGFTLVEVLVVLAIAAVTLGLAVPALGEAVVRHRLRAATGAFLDTLDRARARAVWRNREVTVCASEDGRHCLPTSDWSRGWATMDWRGTVDRMPPLDPRLAVAHRAGRDAIDFAPNGTTRGDNQTVTLCVRGRPATAVSVVIGNAGLARRQTPTADDARACATTPSRTHKDA